MTREEALKVVKDFEICFPNEVSDALEVLIPELTESEDEKVRKELVEKISNLACGCFMSQEQKQKFIHYLENQKEKSKSTDSIQSDCTSNAKCEYRWYKVEDFLPNNPREVLCKDAIGNYFIGRYYSKGIWEISMYDDCDKSNEDNPPVVMWCEIPSEKQQEQKSSDEYIRHNSKELNALLAEQYDKGFWKGKNEKETP